MNADVYWRSFWLQLKTHYKNFQHNSAICWGLVSMAQIDMGNQFMSLSALADGKCKASLQTEGINTFREDKKPCVVGECFSSKFAWRSKKTSSLLAVPSDTDKHRLKFWAGHRELSKLQQTTTCDHWMLLSLLSLTLIWPDIFLNEIVEFVCSSQAWARTILTLVAFHIKSTLLFPELLLLLLLYHISPGFELLKDIQFEIKILIIS